MRTVAGAILTVVLAGCSIDNSVPQYMLDLPRTEEENLRVCEEIRRELGEETQVERVEDYFFVASNDSSQSFLQYKATIVRVYRYLYEDYFSRKPEKPIRVYLFKDKGTYDIYCRSTYDKPPSTPYGFYMSSERKMVMDISTGTGTLAHELVHPLLAEDFPEVPAWFNEGFASLFEHSRTDRDGNVEGLVNWRLHNLKKAIEKGRGHMIEDLLKTDFGAFYGDEWGGNYSTARYLCLWLQAQGLLEKFYHEF